jgi:hypothetical protein
VLSIDESLIEGVVRRPAPLELPPVELLDEEFVLELPEEGLAPPSLVEPARESPRPGPESSWLDAEAPVVELELELEGMEPPEPARPAPAPPAAGPGSAAPFETEPEPGGEPFEIEWQFEPEAELAVGLPEVPPPSAPGATAAPEAARSTGPLDLEELEKTSYEVAPKPVPAARRLEDLLAEAEVFAKYGLREKAHDRAREILQLSPRNVGAMALQLSLWLEEGKHERVVQRAGGLAQVATEAGEREIWNQLRQRLAKTGYKLDGDRVLGAPPPKKAQKDSVAILLEDLVGLGAPKGAPKPKVAAPPLAPPAALAELEAQVGRMPPAKRSGPKAAPAPMPPLEPASAAPVLAAESAYAPAPEPARPPAPPSRPPAAGPLDEEELPGLVISELPSRVAPPPAAEAVPRLTDDGLAWLDRVPTPRGGSKPDEALFEDEEGFFDLAAELEQELSKEELLTAKDLAPAQEQSLEEIVEGFKKGVAESLSPEDYDTHFNLGIAYREMGLLDEAIGEFQLAAKDSKYLLDCCSLLGACFLEKGLPELGVKWYQKGLETPDLSDDATLGLLYDLGSLYATVGETEKARKTFVEIYGVNSNYRDVVARLEELGE